MHVGEGGGTLGRAPSHKPLVRWDWGLSYLTNWWQMDQENEAVKSSNWWTTTFCLSLNPGIPLVVIFVAIYDFREKSGLFSDHIDVLIMYILAVLADAVMIYLAITTMVDLWTREPGSMKRSARLIGIFIVWWIVVNYLPFFAFFPDSKKVEFEWRLFRGTQSLMLLSCVWLVYFYRLRKAFNTVETKELPTSKTVV